MSRGNDKVFIQISRFYCRANHFNTELENWRFLMKTRCNGLVVIALSLAAVSGLFAQKPSDEHVPGRLLVQTVPGTSDSAVAEALALAGAKVHHTIDQIHVHVLDVPEPALDAVSQALMRSGRFTFVERDFVAHPTATPNDPDFVSQWHLTKIQASNAWSLTIGSASIPIAVIDSGADPTHPDLAPKLIPGWNFLTGTTNTSDTGCSSGHGTAVSGAAGADTNNLIGVAGVAWANTIMPLVVTPSGCTSMYSNIASAINYAADHGVRIINVSLAGSTASSTMQSAVDYAWNKGAVVFAAAGNDSSSAPMYPAACTNVVAVSATESNDTLASFSNYGSWIDLSAPGDNILTTMVGGSYGYWWGTSFAAPIAAAVGALALSANPSLTASQLVALLEKNSDDLGSPGYDQNYGWGRVNAYKAVTAAVASKTSTDTTPPTASISAPLAGATVSGTVAVQGTATDNVGVTKIEFYVDGALSTSTTTSPFSFSWDTAGVTNASHTLSVKAYDAAGNVGTASVTVTLSNTAPTVSISSPSYGTTVSGTVSVQGSASDSTGLSKIEFYVNGTLNATAASSPFSFSWNTTSQTTGSDTVSVKAYDTLGNTSTASVAVGVNNPAPSLIADTTPPVVAVTSPANGSTASHNVAITVSATDNVGVTHVSIYVDNVQFCSGISAPYTCNWNTKKASSGSHTITATAWDAAGNAGKATPVTVTK
jgi:thermitase